MDVVDRNHDPGRHETSSGARMAVPAGTVNNTGTAPPSRDSALDNRPASRTNHQTFMWMADRETHPLPPGPADQFDIDANEESFHKMWELFLRFGDIYKIDPPGRDRLTYVVNHPELVQHVLAGNHRNYVKGLGFERVKMLLGNGLIVSEGGFWRRQRQMLQPAFSKQNIAGMSEIMRGCSARLCERWEAKADRGEAINITGELSEMALEVILRAIFGTDLDLLCRDHGGNPFEVLAEHNARDLQLVLKVRALAPIILGVVEGRRRGDARQKDFLSMYMYARDRDSGQPMTDRELVDEVVTLIVAGHETTAATLNWVWYLLSQNPGAEEALHSEVDLLEGGIPRYEDLPRLAYAKQVMQEALRLYPPVWLFTRKAVGEDRLGDYWVAPGTDILLSPYIVHRHPEFWQRPEEFRPERFSEEGAKGRHKFAYFPFSMGARRCTGEFFAFVEVQIHLGLLASRLRLSLIPGQELELEPAVNLRSKHGLMMMPQRR